MNISNNQYKYLSFFLYILASSILLFCVCIRLTPNIYLSTNFRLILLFIVCLLIYISSYILIKKLNYNKKLLNVNIIIYCLIYTFTIFTLTLFDEVYGRQGFVLVKWNKDMLNMYLKYSFNIIPFKTIKLFIAGYKYGLVNFNSFFTNIVGNLCAFMPYSIFLPLIFKKLNNYYRVLLVMIIIVIFIEIFQFITLSGSCDIDDLILNILGFSIAYFLFNIPCIRKGIKKILLYA